MQRRVSVAARRKGKSASDERDAVARIAPWPLLALNFFMADMQAGVGPFLGVYLLAHFAT
jgi:hypothetical protein